MVFWALTGAIVLAAVLILSRQILRRSPEGAGSEITSDMQIYRDQLKELDRDLERGTVGKEEADRTRLEISRRLLDADRQAQARVRATDAPEGTTRLTMGLAAVALIAGSFGLYWVLGSPGAEDLGLKKRIAKAEELRVARPSQAEIEAERPEWPGPPEGTPDDYITLVDSLRAKMQETPDDPRGLDLLVQHETNMGNFIAARTAMDRLMEIKGAEASSDDYARQADVMIMTAGGFVSPEAEEALRVALIKDPSNPVARYYTGLMFAQNSRPDLAFRLWRALLEEGPDGAPWITPIRTQIEGLAQMAGENFTLPPRAPKATAPLPSAEPDGLAGPSAEDMAAAAELSDEDRQDMIRGMVNQLSERLATEGGTPAEWARLITVLGVLGDTERAAAIWGEAQETFAGTGDAFEMVKQAAIQAGVAE
ncbi:c-type cytochrome biogenesis protein CcmI [Aliiroseovarius crassostreae]|uniref:C-type cytochrome biogenesis protein CcmI n=1 Tax=Aliiroseovarius crassostreae TaxID=154981 RepID=A0A9Q9HD29_9RHOB|nr:c-type cytochrome biogenesis protein CcmI [Aliiroseovarius crassostreae]UWP96312.1 c-type cytochrome biogenesis protein CcmI [Aliiroseovarius crassostreae]UWP99477.1 c-type cytochrome biogenesis protein CcmI [Aliiroseovarius crassostreae]